MATFHHQVQPAASGGFRRCVGNHHASASGVTAAVENRTRHSTATPSEVLRQWWVPGVTALVYKLLHRSYLTERAPVDLFGKTSAGRRDDHRKWPRCGAVVYTLGSTLSLHSYLIVVDPLSKVHVSLNQICTIDMITYHTQNRTTAWASHVLHYTIFTTEHTIRRPTLHARPTPKRLLLSDRVLRRTLDTRADFRVRRRGRETDLRSACRGRRHIALGVGC